MRGFLLASMLVAAGSLPASGVVYDLVPIELPGAAGDPREADHRTPFSSHSLFPRRHLGSVAYRYLIGQYPVTVEQYAEFLNAVAADDPNEYWHPRFAENYWQELSNGRGTRRVLFPATIRRSGAPGSYSYSVIVGAERLPMPRPGPRRAFAFANWMHNGQPTGLQDASTTEDGCYDMTVLPPIDGPRIRNSPVPRRKAGCRFWVPSIDEAHKAAYCEPDGSGGCLWRTWPAQPAEVSYIEDVVPGGIRYVNPPRGDRPPDPEPGTYPICQHDGGIGSAASCAPEARGGPNVVTDVDAYASPSPWGAYGMAGNVFEVTDTEVVPEHPGSVFVWGGDLAHGREDASALVITRIPFNCLACAPSFRLAAPAASSCGLGWELIGFLALFPRLRSPGRTGLTGPRGAAIFLSTSRSLSGTWQER